MVENRIIVLKLHEAARQSAHLLDLIHSKINTWNFNEKLYRRQADEQAHTHTNSGIFCEVKEKFSDLNITHPHIIVVSFTHSIVTSPVHRVKCGVNFNFAAFILVVCVCCLVSCAYLHIGCPLLKVLSFISTFRRVSVVCSYYGWPTK